MCLRKVNFRNWSFEVDSELTRKAFEMAINGASEDCNCGYCKNFREQKERAYPEEVKTLFKQLDIDLRKENEVSQVYQLENGLQNYLGWFHFAGKILSGEKCSSPDSNAIGLTQLTENFLIGFCEGENSSFIKVWFETNLPWIID